MTSRPGRVKLLLFLFAQGFIYCTLYLTVLPPVVLFVLISLVSSAFYCILAWMIIADEADYPRSYIIALLIAGVLFRMIVVWHAPVGSDDIFRYIWDGKVLTAGMDPYRYEPSNSALLQLHSELVPAKINFPAMKSIYPPLAEWFFGIVYLAVGESVVGFKLAMVFVELASVVLLFRLLRKMSRPLKYLFLYLLCPLPILQFAVDGHCDVLLFPFLLGVMLFWARGRKIWSYIMLGFSAIARLYPVVLLPALLIRDRGKMKVAGVMITAAVILGAYLPSLLGKGSPFESLKIFSLNWAANGFLFELCYYALRNNQYAHIVLGTVFLAWLVSVVRRKAPLPDMIFEIILGFFLFSPTVHPWYVTTLVLLLPLVPRMSGVVFGALISLATIPLIPFILTGRWSQSIWLMALEYIPVLYLAWREFMGRPVGHAPGRPLPGSS